MVQRSQESGAEIRDYWTPERLADAEPLPRPELAPSEAEPGDLRGKAPAPRGEPGSRPPSAPLGAGVLRSPLLPRLNLGEVAHQTAYPQRTNGKLYFVQGRRRYQCSASTVQTASNNVILTAGHCAYDYRSGWSRKLVFIPAYRAGRRPFGSFGWDSEVVPHGWYRSGNSNYDYAAIRLRSNSRGRVGSVVGEQGINWNYPRRQDYRIIGYPENYGNAQRMWECSSRFQRLNGRGWPGPATTGVDCSMRHGASGGGWTIEDAGGGPRLVSISSYFLRGVPYLFGPYFTRSVTGTLRAAVRR